MDRVWQGSRSKDAGGMEGGRSDMDQTGYASPHLQWTPDRIAGLVCVDHHDGRGKCHVFLDYSNICQCTEKNLNAYRDLVLR